MEISRTEGKPRLMRSLLAPRWMITSLLVLAAIAGMVRLGLWQVDRHNERAAFNQRLLAQIDAPALSLNGALTYEGLAGEQLTEMEYRPVVVSGTFDAQHEVLLRNQVLENRPGYHVFTPLRIAGTDHAVLVDRGFIPLEAGAPADREAFAQSGPVTASGVIRLPHVPRFAGAPEPALAPGETRRDAWNALRLEQIQSQVPYALLPVYVQAAPAPAAGAGAGDAYPVARLDVPEISAGSHMGYALQWFTFAALLALGYPFFVRKQLGGNRKGVARG